MDVSKMLNSVSVPRIPDPFAPRREIKLSQEDITTVTESIAILEKSRSTQEELFEIFDDWQTKRTLTTKRILVSTSVIVSAASWIGIDYTDLTFFGLKIAHGNPERFIIFILAIIFFSGLFYEVSRRIDASVRKAKIANVSQDLEGLKKPVKAIDSVMQRNNIKSFQYLYYDFESSASKVNQKSHAINAFNAVNFYRKHLEGANRKLNWLSLTELVITYLIAMYASIVLVYSLM